MNSKKVLAVVLSLTCVLSLVACGNREEVSNTMNLTENIITGTTSTNEPLEDSSNKGDILNLEASTNGSEFSSESEGAPTEAPHEHKYVANVVQEATCEFVGTTIYTCEICKDSYEEHPNMLDHVLGEYIYNNDATIEANGTESATCKICGNIVDVREKEGTKLEPIATPIPEALDTNVGSELSFEGSVVAPNGVELQKLKEFNKAGLYYASEEFDFNYDWGGYFNNDDPNHHSHDIAQTWSNNMSAMNTQIYGTSVREEQGQAFHVWNRYITFHYVGSAAAGAFELHRHPEEGYYTIHINFDASKNVGGHGVENHRSVLLTLCTFISSTPSELEDAIYNDAFVKTSFNRNYYTSIGDCQVKLGEDDPNVKGLTYIIAPNN